MEFDIKIKRIEDGKLPEYKTEGASGADCFARIYEPITLKPGERKLIPLGFAVEIPEGYEMQGRPRSGLAHKYGITIINTPGTIDSKLVVDTAYGLITEFGQLAKDGKTYSTMAHWAYMNNLIPEYINN